jgi:hypothetical protein
LRLFRLIDVGQRNNQTEQGRLALGDLLESVDNFLINDDRFPFAVYFIITARHADINGRRDRG